MDDRHARLAESDFSLARLKAFLNRIRALVSGQPRELLSYEEVRKSLHIGGPIYRGLEEVPVRNIVGSLNRYHDFDRAFLPARGSIAPKWEKVARAIYRNVGLPPVHLYKVGQVYFVVDGHHRVSVAREQGLETIEAEVRECTTKVNITPDLKPEDLVILGEKVEFLERTHLDQLRPRARVRLTIVGGFDRMIEHIAIHRFVMSRDLKRIVADEEAVTDWYNTAYLPIIKVIRRSRVLREFPGKTEGDMYLWVRDHQRYLTQVEGEPPQSPEEAARDFVGDLDE